MGAALVCLLVPAAVASAASSPVAVYPTPGSKYNLPSNQIAFRGVSAQRIGQIQVVGSKTGTHTGHFVADSDGQGASFLIDHPFAAGEKVTVTTGLNIAGGSGGTFSFTIANPAGAIPAGRLPLVKATSTNVQHFASRPDLEPPTVAVTKNSAPASEGDIFVAPQFGPVQNGPMILDPQGNVVWFQPSPVSTNTLITDFRVQSLHGQPVLTWWQGVTNAGYGRGSGVIFNNDYQQIDTVQAANGLQADLHEFLLTDSGDAYIFAASPVWLPGISHPVIDSVVQEIDISTGLVLFEWHALDHVALSNSYFGVPPTQGHPWDPFHANSIALGPNGDLILSMRNTSAVYEIDRTTGAVVWTVGGKKPSFSMGAGTSTWGQHDATLQPDGTLTLFDDGAGPPTVHPFSRGVQEALDTVHSKATLIKEYDHSPAVSADFEGSMQVLPGGEVFLGYGQQPYFSEFNPAGQLDFDAKFTSYTSSYRAYRFTWNAQPSTSPALAVSPVSDGSLSLYASWNGATDVTSWQVLGGPTASSLAPLDTVPKTGFETTIAERSSDQYFAVQALGSSGQVLATSQVTPTPAHIALYGHSAFIPPSNGTGGVPAACLALHPCKITMSIYAGRTLLARTGAQSLGANSGGVLYFHLSGSALSMVLHARSHRVPVQIVAHDVSGTQTSAAMNLVPFYTTGSGPRRSAHNSSLVRIVGMTSFVSSGWIGGTLAGCFSDLPCHITSTLSAGGTVIAHAGPSLLGAHQLGYLMYTLTSAGHALLARAPGNQVAVAVTLADGTSVATGQIALVGFR